MLVYSGKKSKRIRHPICSELVKAAVTFAFLLVVIQPIYHLTKLSTSKSVWVGFMSEANWG